MQSVDEPGIVNDVEFLTELAAFLRARWKAWLRPLLIVLLIVGGLLPGLVASPTRDTLAPVSRDDYRHDGAWVNRY
jgi:hypothetical protein